MPTNAKVLLHYGPYRSAGVVEHSQNRLVGLLTVLKEHNHQVELIEIPDRDVVELHVNGETVFKCKIKHFDFGGDGALDALCASALKSVEEAF